MENSNIYEINELSISFKHWPKNILPICTESIELRSSQLSRNTHIIEWHGMQYLLKGLEDTLNDNFVEDHPGFSLKSCLFYTRYPLIS